MTLFQTIMIVLMSVGLCVSVGFSVAFVIEAIRENQSKESKKVQKLDADKQKDDEILKMLAQLELETQNVAEEKEEEVIDIEEPVLEEVQTQEKEAEPVVEAQLADEAPATIEEKVVIAEEQPREEVVEESYEDDEAGEEETPKTVIIEKVTTETVGTDFDYNVRLAKIVESKNKMERDLQKTKRAITKYERTQRRRTRNQKMLDRRAVELTNLNLMMYSVTDIKNVDADKKEKQKELTTHIAELKAGIQDADIFLDKNKERYEHDKKMFAFYTKEEVRYNDEIKELEILIKNANSVTGSTTTTTTTTTETV